MESKRLTIFAGHYGSGKTNIALNYAHWLKDSGREVTIADLDIVNPYFRTKDNESELASAGIGLICSPFANSNVDAPAMPKEIYALVEDRQTYGVLDVGGDDRGALALGRYVPSIKEENNYEMYFVINKSRPLTRTPEDTIDVMKEIEEACNLPFTAIVNNTNLALQSTAENFLNSLSYAEEISALSGLPVKMNCVSDKIYPELKDSVPNLFALNLQKLYYQV